MIVVIVVVIIIIMYFNVDQILLPVGLLLGPQQYYERLTAFFRVHKTS